MVEKVRKLITYPDDKLSIERYICYLEQFDSWFMHTQDIVQNAVERGFPERALVAIPLDTVQAEIYLQQHSMSKDQLEYAIDAGFKYNKRFTVTHLNLNTTSFSGLVQIPEYVEFYKIELHYLPYTTTCFQVTNDKEFLQQVAAFEGSITN